MTQTITALFDRQAEAQTAADQLAAAGIARSAIRLIPGASTANRTSGSYDHARDEGGFWDSLKDLFMPEEDRYSYSEGLSRGGTMLSVAAEPNETARVVEILERHGSVDLDERETSWRREGWRGYTGGAAGAGAGAGGTAGTAGRDETIPIVEEQLRVGKRVAQQGRVRVHSYAVERPVNEQVNLRDETVHVERRKVDRAPTSADEALFAERTIEATERREEPVVSKEARVVEEVGLRKEAEQRTEQVSDTVRRTEVEVEDERGNVSRTGTTDTTGRPR